MSRNPPALKVKRQFGYVEGETPIRIREVCPDYVAHLHTVIERHLPSGRVEKLLPDCRHALTCQCTFSEFGPLRGAVVAERASWREADEAIATIVRGSLAVIDVVPSKVVKARDPYTPDLFSFDAPDPGDIPY